MSANQNQLRVFYNKYLDTAGFVGDKLKKLQAVDWDTWMNTPGPNPIVAELSGKGETFDFSTEESDKAFALADEYVALAGEHSPFNL